MTLIIQTLLDQTLDWNFPWHFSSCDYSISGTNTGTFPHLKQAFWGKSEYFSVFHLLLLQRDQSPMWQDSWIRLWTVTSLLYSMLRVGLCLLKRLLSTQACPTYANFKKFLRKLEKYVRRGLFCESCGITDDSCLKEKFNTYALLKIHWRCWLKH